MPKRSHQLPAEQLHETFLKALDGQVLDHSPIPEKPLEVDLASPLPPHVRAYLFNATHPPGGRTMGEHKVQLMLPGQQRGERANFDHSGGRIVLLVGYESEMSVFVLWDAGLYRNFPFSRNVQVRAETIYEAYAKGLALQERRLWGHAREVLIAAFAPRLSQAIQMRVGLSLTRLLGEAHV
ncbi:MAG: hypothetical protein V2A71_03715 [Candidatus Eisenbacteria bacterium]